jgi:predicted dienelactone hydrolase
MKVPVLLFWLLVWSLGTVSAPAGAEIGFQQFSVPDSEGRPISVAVWYPSAGTAVSVPFGPFRQTVVTGGILSGTALPLILISHGS